VGDKKENGPKGDSKTMKTTSKAEKKKAREIFGATGLLSLTREKKGKKGWGRAGKPVKGRRRVHEPLSTVGSSSRNEKRKKEGTGRAEIRGHPGAEVADKRKQIPVGQTQKSKKSAKKIQDLNQLATQGGHRKKRKEGQNF